MSRNMRAEDDSLVCIESRCDEKTNHEHPPITNEFLEKFYNHCANIIIDCWKLHKKNKTKKQPIDKPLPTHYNKPRPPPKETANVDDRPIPMLNKQKANKPPIPHEEVEPNISAPDNKISSDQPDEFAEPIVKQKVAVESMPNQNAFKKKPSHKKPKEDAFHEIPAKTPIDTPLEKPIEKPVCKYDEIPLPALSKKAPISTIAELERPLPTLKKKEKANPDEMEYPLTDENAKIDKADAEGNGSKPKKTFLKRTKKYDPKEAIMKEKEKKTDSPPKQKEALMERLKHKKSCSASKEAAKKDNSPINLTKENEENEKDPASSVHSYENDNGEKQNQESDKAKSPPKIHTFLKRKSKKVETTAAANNDLKKVTVRTDCWNLAPKKSSKKKEAKQIMQKKIVEQSVGKLQPNLKNKDMKFPTNPTVVFKEEVREMMSLEGLEESFNVLHKNNEDLPLFFGKQFRIDNDSIIPMIQLNSKFVESYTDSIYDSLFFNLKNEYFSLSNIK